MTPFGRLYGPNPRMRPGRAPAGLRMICQPLAPSRGDRRCHGRVRRPGRLPVPHRRGRRPLRTPAPRRRHGAARQCRGRRRASESHLRVAHAGRVMIGYVAAWSTRISLETRSRSGVMPNNNFTLKKPLMRPNKNEPSVNYCRALLARGAEACSAAKTAAGVWDYF
jgi:hypothetical protein